MRTGASSVLVYYRGQVFGTALSGSNLTLPFTAAKNFRRDEEPLLPAHAQLYMENITEKTASVLPDCKCRRARDIIAFAMDEKTIKRKKENRCVYTMGDLR